MNYKLDTPTALYIPTQIFAVRCEWEVYAYIYKAIEGRDHRYFQGTIINALFEGLIQ